MWSIFMALLADQKGDILSNEQRIRVRNCLVGKQLRTFLCEIGQFCEHYEQNGQYKIKRQYFQNI